MNNKTWVYRFSKPDFWGVGPYGYMLRKIYLREGLVDNDIKELKDTLWKKERWYGHKYQDNINSILHQYQAFRENGCFSSYKTHRPGPWDDPLMKYNLRNRFGSRENLSKYISKWNGFGFDSMRQLENWFNDPEEIKLLNKFGFKLYREKIETKNIIFGDKQVWVII
jgi:hypothetical protein